MLDAGVWQVLRLKPKNFLIITFVDWIENKCQKFKANKFWKKSNTCNLKVKKVRNVKDIEQILQKVVKSKVLFQNQTKIVKKWENQQGSTLT